MEFEMKLHPKPFEEIKSGKKKTEIRLNDEKRKCVKPGDTIIFRKRPQLKDQIKVKVISRKNYKEYPNLSEYYSKKEQEKYGVVVFEIKLL